MSYWDHWVKYIGGNLGGLGSYPGSLQDLARRQGSYQQYEQMRQQGMMNQQRVYEMAQLQMQQLQVMPPDVPERQQEKLDKVKAAVEEAYATCREREEAAFLEGEEFPNLAWLDRRVEEVRAW